MAGRPLGIKSLVRALGKLTSAQIKGLLSKVPRTSHSEKLERLQRERDKHLAAAKRLDRQIAMLSGRNGAVTTSGKSGRKPGRKKGYKLTLATRRKMSEAAKRRHAGGAKSGAPASARKRKRKPFSAETKARMAAAQKARWAKVKRASVGKKAVHQERPA